MSDYNKQFRYEGHLFNIKVELNHQVERRLGGKVEHLIIINDLGPNNYYKKVLCESKDLEKTIGTMESDAKNWVDSMKGSKSEDQKLLEGLGFK